MGIEGFNPFIAKNAPQANVDISVIKFANTVIAIDAHNYIYTNMYVSLKQALVDVDLRNDPSAEHDNVIKMKTCIKQLLRFASLLASYSITPVFVFDGPNIKGKVVRDERKKRTQKTYEQIALKTEQLESLDPLERTDDDIQELRRLRGSVTRVKTDEMELFKTVLKNVGIPVIQADGDGEHLCCMLVREGLATAVFSRDTDCMVYGAQFMIKRIKKISSNRYHIFEITQFAPILPSLGMSYNTFVDLCIMARCDYNINIPKVGIGRAYKYLLKHGSIEHVIEKEGFDAEYLSKDWLNCEQCREDFSMRSSVSLLHDESHHGEMPKLVIDKNAIKSDTTRDILRLYDCDDMIMLLSSSYHNVSKVLNLDRNLKPLSDSTISYTKSGKKIIFKKPRKAVEQTIDEKEEMPVADDPLEVLKQGSHQDFESYD